MTDRTHLDQVRSVKPPTRGCEVREGDRWVPLCLWLGSGSPIDEEWPWS